MLPLPLRPVRPPLRSVQRTLRFVQRTLVRCISLFFPFSAL